MECCRTSSRERALRFITILVFAALVIPTALGQCAVPAKNDLEFRGLSGPVHTVQTTVVSRSPAPAVPLDDGVVEEVFNRNGFIVETKAFDAHGALQSHTVMQRNGSNVRTETTQFGGPDPKRLVSIFSEGGRMENDTYNLDGTIRERTVLDPTPAGLRETRYDSAGRVVSDVLDKGHPQKEIGAVPAQASAKGKTAAVVPSQDDPGDSKTTTQDQGHPEFFHQRDSTGERFLHVTPHRTDMTACDSQGRTETQVVQTGESYSRIALRYDSRDRLAETDIYNRAGKIIQRTLEHYEDDSHGNWTLRRSETLTPGSENHDTVVTERSISYY